MALTQDKQKMALEAILEQQELELLKRRVNLNACRLQAKAELAEQSDVDAAAAQVQRVQLAIESTERMLRHVSCACGGSGTVFVEGECDAAPSEAPCPVCVLGEEEATAGGE